MLIEVCKKKYWQLIIGTLSNNFTDISVNPKTQHNAY